MPPAERQTVCEKPWLTQPLLLWKKDSKIEQKVPLVSKQRNGTLDEYIL